MGTGLFWGGMLILLGIVLIIKVVFNIDFPVFKVMVGLFFIFLGLKFLFGRVLIPHGTVKPEDTIFSEQLYTAPETGKEYNVIFGRGVYDFTDADLSEGDVRVKINTVFGGSLVKISKDMPVEIKADAVFAGAELPDGNTAVFGSSRYMSDTYRSDSTALYIEIGVVFGGVQVVSR